MQTDVKQIQGFIYKLKMFDESVANSIVLQNDDELQFPMLANEVWQFEFFFFWDAAAATPDISFSLNGPGTPMKLQAHLIGTDSNAEFAGGGQDGIVITAYGTLCSPSPTSAPTSIGWIRGVVWNGITAGNLALQWCQRSSNATPTFVRAGSYVQAMRIIP
jgi:hypothetical protein